MLRLWVAPVIFSLTCRPVSDPRHHRQLLQGIETRKVRRSRMRCLRSDNSCISAHQIKGSQKSAPASMSSRPLVLPGCSGGRLLMPFVSFEVLFLITSAIAFAIATVTIINFSNSSTQHQTWLLNNNPHIVHQLLYSKAPTVLASLGGDACRMSEGWCHCQC